MADTPASGFRATQLRERLLAAAQRHADFAQAAQDAAQRHYAAPAAPGAPSPAPQSSPTAPGPQR